MRIGLFDSGVGGLTVLKNLQDKYPHNDYIYFGDTLNIPYGAKSKDELISLSKKDVDFLISKQVEAIVIACGTISSNCLSYLKSNYHIPIYDIISPITNYLNHSNYSNICVIATEATINSHIFFNSINKNVIEIATPKLVPLIENNELDSIPTVISEYLDKYKDNIDALVLGCTHYGIIKEYLKEYFNNQISILDMGEFIVENFTDGNEENLELYFSRVDNHIASNVTNIIGNYKINEK